MPLCIGGGIRDYTDSKGVLHSALDVAAEYFRSGADKVWLGVFISMHPCVVLGVCWMGSGCGVKNQYMCGVIDIWYGMRILCACTEDVDWIGG